MSCPRRDLHRDDVGETQKNNSARVSGRALMVRGPLPDLCVSTSVVGRERPYASWRPCPPKIRHESEVNRVISVMGVEVSHLLYEKYSFSKMFSSYTSQNTINLTNLLNFERDRHAWGVPRWYTSCLVYPAASPPLYDIRITVPVWQYILINN